MEAPRGTVTATEARATGTVTATEARATGTVTAMEAPRVTVTAMEAPRVTVTAMEAPRDTGKVMEAERAMGTEIPTVTAAERRTAERRLTPAAIRVTAVMARLAGTMAAAIINHDFIRIIGFLCIICKSQSCLPT